MFGDSKFGLPDEVWRYAWDEEGGVSPARTSAAGRVQSVVIRRFIVHYMQPRFPNFPEPIASGIDLDAFETEWDSTFDQLNERSVSRERVWDSYRANLTYVLDGVRALLVNIYHRLTGPRPVSRPGEVGK